MILIFFIVFTIVIVCCAKWKPRKDSFNVEATHIASNINYLYTNCMYVYTYNALIAQLHYAQLLVYLKHTFILLVHSMN